MGKLQVLHISIYPEKGKLYSKKGGVASYLKNLIGSKSLDHIIMSVLADIDYQEEIYEESKIKVYRKWAMGVKSIFQICKFLIHHKKTIDVVHLQHELNLFGSIFVGYLILFLPFFFRKIKFILTSHHAVNYKDINTAFVENHNQKMPVFVVKFSFKVLYFLYKFRDKIIVHENIHKARLEKQYGINKKNIKVIPHGVENKDPLSKGESKEKLGLSLYDNVLFYMGYVTGYKDLKIMIEGYALRVRDNPKSILIIGAGPEKKSKDNVAYMEYYLGLQTLAKKLIPQKNYQWLGFVDSDDIPLYYSACDLILLPYRYTLSASGPMAIAIAYETPFLASECFVDYFPEFNQCIFKFNHEGMKEGIEYFYKNKDDFLVYIKTLKDKRQYELCLERTILFYSKK